MNLHLVSKRLVVLAALPFFLSTSQTGFSQELNSFRASNFPDRYIRHRNFLGYVNTIVANDSLGRKDATFRIVYGLAGKCSSFESVNMPGHYLRHQNYRLKLAKWSADKGFKADATFCLVKGLANATQTSFESVNFPKHYIRHQNFELWLAQSDGSLAFRKDATFITSPALTTHAPAGPIDHGTELVPARNE